MSASRLLIGIAKTCRLNVIDKNSCKIYISSTQTVRSYSNSQENDNKSGVKKATTPVGKLDDKWEAKSQKMEPQAVTKDGKDEDPYAPFPDNKNPVTGEIGGPRGPEPTRYGDWERKGRVIDF